MVKKWKKFEDETHRIVQKLNSSDSVFKNVYLVGKLSERKRQVDVQLIDPKKYDFIVFECKDYKRPIDIDKIEAFNTKLTDLGARKGAIVANSAFTKSAEKMASKLKIDLLNLVVSSNKDINSKMSAPTMVVDMYVSSFSVKVGTAFQSGDSFSIDPSELTLLDEEGNGGPASDIFKNVWNDRLSSEVDKEGWYKYSITPTGKKIVSIEGNEVDLNHLSFHYEVKKRYYLGEIDLIETEGLYNVQEKSYTTQGILTEKIVLSDLQKSWKEISQEEVDKIQVFIRIGVVSAFS